MEKINIIELMDNHLIGCKVNTEKDTQKYYYSMYKYLKKYLDYYNILYLDELKSYLHIISFFKETTTLKYSSIKKIVKYIGTFLNFNDIKIDLGKKIKLPNDSIPFEVPPKSLIKKVFNYVFNLDDSANNILYKLIIALARDTGLRRNELINLKWKDIHYDPNYIDVFITKNHKKRVVFFSNNLSKPLLLKAFKKNSKENDYVLFNYLKNEKCSKDTFDYCFDKICKKLDIKGFTGHRLRKFFATDLFVELKGDLLTVSKLLGHSSLDQTKNYVKPSMDYYLSQYNKAMKKN